MSLDDMLAFHDKALLEKAAIFFDPELSVARKPFTYGVDFRKASGKKMLKNFRKMVRMQQSFRKSEDIIRRSSVLEPARITDNDAEKLLKKIRVLKIDAVGTTVVEPKFIFREKGIPYKNVLVISIEMDKEKVLTAPSTDCMIEVANAYGKSGHAANVISRYLTSMGYGAMPGHSLGGSISYPEMAQEAGMGKLGIHGLLISKKNGPSNRISVVYTNITNLGEYIKQDEDYSWIKEFCDDCRRCIRTCPTTAIFESVTLEKSGRGRCTDHELCIKNFSEQLGCSICIRYCPFTKMDYTEIKNSYSGKKE
jgi:ferredoxin